MKYKAYEAVVEFDESAEIFFGRVINTVDVITFQSDSASSLQKEFAASVDDYLSFCTDMGECPEKPYSGKLLVRLDANLHREVALAAARNKLSINSWVSQALSEALPGKADGRRSISPFGFGSGTSLQGRINTKYSESAPSKAPFTPVHEAKPMVAHLWMTDDSSEKALEVKEPTGGCN